MGAPRAATIVNIELRAGDVPAHLTAEEAKPLIFAAGRESDKRVRKEKSFTRTVRAFRSSYPECGEDLATHSWMLRRGDSIELVAERAQRSEPLIPRRSQLPGVDAVKRRSEAYGGPGMEILSVDM
jgi:hypothetical protein